MQRVVSSSLPSLYKLDSQRAAGIRTHSRKSSALSDSSPLPSPRTRLRQGFGAACEEEREVELNFVPDSRVPSQFFLLSLSERERIKVRDCSLAGSEDELSRVPHSLTCAVDDERHDHRSKSYSGAGGETRSDAGGIRADQKN